MIGKRKKKNSVYQQSSVGITEIDESLQSW